MKMVMAGGSGQVGRILSRAFAADGHEVVILSRGARPSPYRVVEWDGEGPGAWEEEIDRADVMINLAGRSLYCRYNEGNRREMMESRVRSTVALGRAGGGRREFGGKRARRRSTRTAMMRRTTRRRGSWAGRRR
jgi:NAD dependent epimerase/dehydratase family enzyme